MDPRVAHAIRAAKADGGSMQAPPFYARAEAAQMGHTGAIPAMVGGRTDHVPMSVPSGSYVLPADIVSALGEHNTLMGFKILDKMFQSAPWGTSMPQLGRGPGPGMPRAPMPGRAAGGRAPVDIVAAGGEYVVPPDAVAALGRGDMDKGHEILDHFVRTVRNKSIKTLQKLPGPKRD